MCYVCAVNMFFCTFGFAVRLVMLLVHLSDIAFVTTISQPTSRPVRIRYTAFKRSSHGVGARADRLSRDTEIGSVESGAKPCHATDVQTVSELCSSIMAL